MSYEGTSNWEFEEVKKLESREEAEEEFPKAPRFKLAADYTYPLFFLSFFKKIWLYRLRTHMMLSCPKEVNCCLRDILEMFQGSLHAIPSPSHPWYVCEAAEHLLGTRMLHSLEH